MDQKKCAILYFTRSSLSESRKKKWFNSYEQNLKFANTIISTTRQTLLQTGMDVLEINEDIQVGDTFENRITNAFEYGFSKGYDSLILVGNDTLGLETTHLCDAKLLLEDAPTVFGANFKGGVYLIGFQEKQFRDSKTTFEQLPWQTKGLWENICLHFGTCVLGKLEVLSDINSQMDLFELLSNPRTIVRLKALLLRAINSDRSPENLPISFIKLPGYRPSMSLRGPPQIAA